MLLIHLPVGAPGVGVDGEPRRAIAEALKGGSCSISLGHSLSLVLDGHVALRYVDLGERERRQGREEQVSDSG
jgi:hypothetical protein